jgi:prepilin-type N-terminal cleavage/methylation domain-containing protein
MKKGVSVRTSRTAFTLVELAVVVVVIGALAAFGVPRFIRTVERSKAAEAFAYLSAVRSAQERYAAREGVYASDLSAIDVDVSPPRFFVVQPSKITDRPRDSWSLTLKRAGSPPGYGAYTVTFTQDGYDPAHSTIDGIAEINPIGAGGSGAGAAGGS